MGQNDNNPLAFNSQLTQALYFLNLSKGKLNLALVRPVANTLQFLQAFGDNKSVTSFIVCLQKELLTQHTYAIYSFTTFPPSAVRSCKPTAAFSGNPAQCCTALL